MTVFTFKVWLTTVLTAPLFMLLVFSVRDDGKTDILSFYSWMLVYGVVLSMPYVLAFWACTKLALVFTELRPIVLKTLFSALTILGIYISFLMFKLRDGYSVEMYAYLIASIGAIWLYRLEPVSK